MTDHPTEQEIAEAVGTIMDWARRSIAGNADLHHFPDLARALATLEGVRLVAVPEGHHVYTSRFKVGDQVWNVTDWWGTRDGTGWRVFDEALEWNYELLTEDSDCFPTRAEAEAECARRNAGKD